MRVKRTKERTVAAVFRIRGQIPEAAVLACQNWEQAVQEARRVLPRFEQRNPWLYFDSRHQKLHVLLDPDSATQAHKSEDSDEENRSLVNIAGRKR